MTEQKRWDEAQRRIKALVIRNAEIEQRLEQLRERTAGAEKGARPTRGSVERAEMFAVRADDLAEEAHGHAVAAHRRAAMAHEQTARRQQAAADAGSGDEEVHRARAARHLRDAATDRERVARADRR